MIVHYTYLGVSDYNLQNYCFLLSEDLFYLYSVDHGEIQHYAAFHLGLHCLQKYLFRGSPNTKALTNYCLKNE